ncbi:tannase/feruloyl esterase family alpha/beta hydrolase [Bacillus thermotolerans]|uniref:Tannase and feruloyl esterase n=2 Tax=Bacillus thermotolerans TaxID=1221996 RepID=A0A0F5HN51_BACTR|nr:tannase/feruloyl esterase family alpha/beta hydrolase [Bacillus thermotolerans]KKB34257.1 Tannase and feruloyl esterase [Bacillus thermotolerans]
MRKSVYSILLAFVLLILVSSAGTTAEAKEKPSSLANGEKSCLHLNDLTISKSSIGLRTSGASVTDAVFVADEKNGEFCQVKGAIHPVDPSAPDIQFQVNLPSEWNRKALQMGGGGFNGVLVTGLENNRYDPKDTPTPLARGFVTLGSDSGHAAKGNWDGSFAMNNEALANFAGDQIKKTHDTALAIINAYYHTQPEQMYFSGGSEGGREGLVAIQKWPNDYDRAVIFYPVYNWIAKAIQDNRNTQALLKNNGEGWISPEENSRVNEIVLQACDSLDGVEDRMISNTEGCADKSDQILQDLAQAGFSKAQLEVIKTFNSPMEFSFKLANNVTSIAGYSQLEGADIGSQFGTSPAPSSFSEHGAMAQFSDQVLRYMVAKDANLDAMSFNPNEWKKEIQTASKLLEPSKPNLSAFKALGGKVLLVHGTTDQIVTPYGSIDYYKQLEKKYGNKLDDFLQFYLIPGYGHGYGEFNMTADLLSELDSWVSTGEAPVNLVTADKESERTRPMCEFPSWPQYDGTGDTHSAENYSCVQP